MLLTMKVRFDRDSYLTYSPDREGQDNVELSARNIPKVVDGIDAHCRGFAADLWRSAVVEVVPVSSCNATAAIKDGREKI